ncbi:MAG: hypothetical protein GY795_15920 [Desulfobacterales bacterium]|nr:hypothetical protein [Desulfobacterales bacterium]
MSDFIKHKIEGLEETRKKFINRSSELRMEKSEETDEDRKVELKKKLESIEKELREIDNEIMELRKEYRDSITNISASTSGSGSAYAAGKNIEIRGDKTNIEGKDIAFAKDQATASPMKFSSNAAQNVYNEIAKAIRESNGDNANVENAREQLDRMGKELQKTEIEKGRLESCWNYIVNAIPEVAKVVPWEKLIEKVLI